MFVQLINIRRITMHLQTVLELLGKVMYAEIATI